MTDLTTGQGQATRLAGRPEEIAYLKARDPRLAAFMELAGPLEIEIIPDLFAALVHIVAGQQISTRVHATLWARIRDAIAPLTPAHILSLPVQALRDCGLSQRKADYIRGIAEAFADGSLREEELVALDDAALCERLCALRGIGQWSAEMLLIFCLQRRDVLSLGDFGIRRGLRMLYGVPDLDPDFLAACRARYSPCASVASLYLWELASGNYPDYPDPGEKPKARRTGAPKRPDRQA